MKDNFFKEAELLHKDRIKEQERDRHSLTTQAKYEYNNFSFWCRANEKAPNETNFKTYLKEENRNVNFWVLKTLFELYFSYEYKFDYDNKKWLAKKIAK